MQRDSRMAEHGFSLALEKTKVVILVKEMVSTVFPIQVGDAMVLPKPSMK